MDESDKLQLRPRTQTKHKLPESEQTDVIANGFGTLQGQYQVGRAVGKTKRVIYVQFKDEDGRYTESYDAISGIRTQDLGDDDGWRISLSDLEPRTEPFLPESHLVKDRNDQNRFEKLHSERLPFADHDSEDDDHLVIEVWLDNVAKKRYLKYYRTGEIMGSNKTLKPRRQLPALLPFELVRRLLAEFEIKWD